MIAGGDEVSERRAGDREIVPFQVSCGTCDACRDGRFGACHTYRARAGAAFGFGGNGDHMLLHVLQGSAAALCALPDNACDACAKRSTASRTRHAVRAR